MQAKAEAFTQYGEAAVLDLLVRVLPQVVAAAPVPMGAIDKMTVIPDPIGRLDGGTHGENMTPTRTYPRRGFTGATKCSG